MNKSRPRLLPHSHFWVAWGYDVDTLNHPTGARVHAYCRSIDHRWCVECLALTCKCARIFTADQWTNERYTS